MRVRFLKVNCDHSLGFKYHNRIMLVIPDKVCELYLSLIGSWHMSPK